MSKTKRALMLVVAVLGLVVLSAGIAVAAGDDDETTTPANVSGGGAGDENETAETEDADGQEGDASLTGASADKAAEAALAKTGGGTVLAVESDDDGAGYEVEIRKSDGSEAEVELDGSFAVTQRSEDD